MKYLYDSHKLVETAYELEKEGGFDGEGTPRVARVYPPAPCGGIHDASGHVVLGVAAERGELRQKSLNLSPLEQPERNVIECLE